MHFAAARRQQAAALAIRSVPSDRRPDTLPRLEYAYEFDRSGAIIRNAEPAVPKWAVQALGSDVFFRVVGVSWDGFNATDEDLQVLAELPHLERLDLEYSQVTDEGLKFLCGLTKLKRLDLQESNISSNGLKHVGALANLEILLLGDIAFDVSDVAFLDKLTRLESLAIRKAGLQDRDTGPLVDRLSKLQNLVSLDLSRNAISDDSIKELVRLKRLKKLRLHDTNISDRGVNELGQELEGCTITLL